MEDFEIIALAAVGFGASYALAISGEYQAFNWLFCQMAQLCEVVKYD